MEKPKYCPFCGGQAKAGVEFGSICGYEVKLQAVVECRKCGVRKAISFKATDVDTVSFERYVEVFTNVVDEWNRRAYD